MLLTPVVFLLASSMKLISGADWCYDSQVSCNHTCTGPDFWGTVSQQCSGRSQSPVNIITRNALPDERLTPLHFIGYQAAFHGHLVNSGHSVQLELPHNIKIKGGHLASVYKAVQLHLHWGKDGGPGSEHTVDGEYFPMEMHIVHIKEKYDSLSEAVRDRSGVAVLGFFFQESKSTNKKYDPLINALQSITRPNTGVTLRGVSLDMLIPPRKDLTKYFRYDGSLTTPGCAEAVVWTLFENTIPLSKKQLAAFSHLQFADGTRMVRTYRPTQPMNGRQVYYSAGSVALISTALFLMSGLLSITWCLQAGG